jgi:hypothetical protein
VRRLDPYDLWLGHAGDARDLRAILSAGIAAVIDLALEEPPVPVTRDLLYCRFPLLDGAGNAGWLLRAAVETTAALVRAKVPTLVCCGAGMSRSPAIAALALARVEGRAPEECVALVQQSGACDISPLLWHEIQLANGGRESDEAGATAGGPLRVLVSGARTWTDRETIRRELARLPVGSVIIHGDARGADRLAGEVAAELGLTVLACPAEWHKYGRAAGLVRNRAMLAEHRPQRVIAFHPAIEEARGTKHMVELARQAGVEVRVVSGREEA